MSYRTTIVTGVLLLLLAASGFIYVMARQEPPLETIEPQQLTFETAKPSPAVKLTPSPAATHTSRRIIRYSTTRPVRAPKPEPIKTFAVELLSPSMAETFLAPANVVLKASANHERELKGIEFYRSPETTVCQSLTKLMRLPEEFKIGGAVSAPYEVRWTIPEPGTFTIMAVATYAGGEQQISPPVVIIVNGPEKDERAEPPLPPITALYRLFPADWEQLRSSRNRTCPLVSEPVQYTTMFEVDRDTIEICPINSPDPANTRAQVTLSALIEGTYSNPPTFRYWTNGGKILNDGARSIWDLSGVKAGVYTIIARADDGCDCTNIKTKTVTVTNSCAPIDPPEGAGGPPDIKIDGAAPPTPSIIDMGTTARRVEGSTMVGTTSEAANTGTREVEISTPTETPPINPPPDTSHGRPRTKEKEWMKLSWTPFVKSDDTVTVKIVYDRTTESLNVIDTAGVVSEELKLGKLLKEWFGKDYQAFGDVRLRTAGLKCDSCNQEQYQSFDKEKLEWSWPLKPEGTGKQSFNVELWVKGEPRARNSGKPSIEAEKVWSRIENKIEVIEPFLTRNTVYAGGGLCAVLGLGLCVRGLKIYRIGDTYNVGQAVAVGRNVTMTNTTVNQQTEKNDLQNGENRDA